MVSAAALLLLCGCYRAHGAQDDDPERGAGPTPQDGGSVVGRPRPDLAGPAEMTEPPEQEASGDGELRFTSVAAGAYSSCALLSDGQPVCWGLTCSTPDPRRRDPLECFGRTCRIESDGHVQCESFGGADGIRPADSAAGAVTAGPFDSLHVTQDFGCGLRADGMLDCWGAPVFTEQAARYEEFSLGLCMGCGLRLDGTLDCPHACRGPSYPPQGRHLKVSAGDRHACAVREDGELRCWGAGTQTRITGVGGSNDCPSFPQACGQAAPPAGEFVEVSAGRFHSCAIARGGEVVCWGLGTRDDGCELDSYQCGQAMPPPGAFVALAAGAAHTCGVRTTGELSCWGAGTTGSECGPLTRTSPHCAQSRPPAGEYVAVAAGYWHSCALDLTGALHCWGMGQERGACFDSSRDSRFDYQCGQSLPPGLPEKLVAVER